MFFKSLVILHLTMEDVMGVGEAGQAFLPDAHGAAPIQDPIEEASVLFRLVCFDKSNSPFCL